MEMKGETEQGNAHLNFYVQLIWLQQKEEDGTHVFSSLLPRNVLEMKLDVDACEKPKWGSMYKSDVEQW